MAACALLTPLDEIFPADDPIVVTIAKPIMFADLIELRMAWWFKWYLFGVTAMCMLTGCEPKQEKSLYWCQNAIRARCNGKRIKISSSR
jgi:hypothetical protein